MDHTDSKHPLEIYCLPLVTAPSHSLPLYSMARVFAARGQHATIITTPFNAKLLQSSSTDHNPNISFHIIPMPFKEVGLSDNFNELSPINDLHTAMKLHQAFSLLRKPIEDFSLAHPPHCIISDRFHTWSADFAARLHIPRLVFSPCGAFPLCLTYAMLCPDSPHQPARSDNRDEDPFLVPGLPDPITMTRSQIPEPIYNELIKRQREAEMKSYGVLINTFYEFESAYVEHHKKSMGHKVFPIGPASLIHLQLEEDDSRPKSEEVKVSDHECQSWLNSKPPNSVVYLCFGSYMALHDEQLKEIASALDSSGHYFIWVVRGKDGQTEEEEEEKWLPKGYRQKINGRGLIAEGWVPQLLILNHPSVGGFITHCGWSSILEGVSAGVPFVTWPLSADNFYNEKLLTQVLGIGVEVGVDDWKLWCDLGKKLIKSERIEKAVRKLMDGGDEAEEMRTTARKLGEKAKMAVKEGGSSHRNLTVLIEDLKQLRDSIKVDGPPT